MKYLGIDWGARRIGVAVSDEGGSVAFPLTTITAGPEAVAQIAALVEAQHAQALVLGESRDFNNAPNPAQSSIAAFRETLQSASGVPVLFEPEFMTSAAAARQFAPEGSRKKNPPHIHLDAAAAALILQSYLDKNRQ